MDFDSDDLILLTRCWTKSWRTVVHGPVRKICGPGARQNAGDAAALVLPELNIASRSGPPVLAGLQRALEVPAIDSSNSPRTPVVRSGRRRGEPLSVALAVSLAAAVIGLGLTIGLVALLGAGPSQVAVGPSSPPPKVALVPKEPAPRQLSKLPSRADRKGASLGSGAGTADYFASATGAAIAP